MDWGGKGKFFRVAIGLDYVEPRKKEEPKLREGVKTQSSGKAQFEFLTPLYMEMKIALEYLGISHSAYKKLSREDRLKCVLYELMKMEREEYFNKQTEKQIRAQKAK